MGEFKKSKKFKKFKKFLKNNRKMSFIVACIFILSVVVLPWVGHVFAAGSLNLKVETVVDKSEAYPGEEFTYTIKYRNANITTSAPKVVIKDVLPSNIEFLSSSSVAANPHIESIVATEENGSDVVTITFKDPLEAGATGIVKITARFHEGTTIPTVDGNPNVAVNKPDISSNGSNTVESNEVTVTPKFKAPDWSITKSKVVPQMTPAVGQPVTYQIAVTGNSAVGGQDMENVVLWDDLPANVEFVSASNGGTYDSGKVTWNIGTLKVGTTETRSVTVKYTATNYDTSSNVTNTAEATGNVIGDTTALNVSANESHGFAVPTFSAGTFSKDGRQENDRYSVGQTAEFYLNKIENAGNIPMDSFVVEDTIPSEIKLTAITTGAYSSNTNVVVKYKTNLNNTDWITWTGSPFTNPSNQTLQVSSLGLATDDFVTNVRWEISGEGGSTGGIPAGFSNTSSIQVNGTVSMPSVGNEITNNASMTANKSGETPITINDDKKISVIDPMPWIQADKSVVSNWQVYENEQVKFKLVVGNHNFATGDFHDPIAIDVLPSQLENVTFLPAETVINSSNSVTVSDMSVNGNNLRWNLTGTLAPGDTVELYYTATVKVDTLVGSYTNDLYVTTNTDTVFENDSELINDTSDLDSDGKINDRLIKSSADIYVKFIGSLDSKKYVRGELDVVDSDPSAGWQLLEDVGSTLPGGIADYKLIVKNSGSNGPISNVVIIDKLPFIGDTGVLDSQSRESAWRPYLVNQITGENGAALPAGMTVYYSTEANPSLAELDDPRTTSNTGWSTTPPADITTVTAIKINFGSIVLEADDEIVLEWPMRAPVEAPRGEITWNSFAYGATYPDYNGQEPFLPSEPIKVGFEVKDDPASTYYIGNYVWDDLDKDGIQDSGEPGINGVLVNLYEAGTSNLLAYTRTGEKYHDPSLTGTEYDGYYDFPDLPNGNYDIEFVFPKDYKVTLPDVGLDEEVDSDISNVGYDSTNYTDNDVDKYTVKVSGVTISDASRLDIDAGLYKVASIGNYVWNDYDADGIQDSNESGISGVTVKLLDGDGNPAKYGDDTLVPDQTTDADGSYKFTDLEPGNYKVQIVNPGNNYKFSKINQGTDLNDSDTDDPPIGSDTTGTISPTSTSEAVFLYSGEYNPNIDFGMYLAQIGDLVWDDYDADGIKDSGEPGVKNVTVNLLDTGGSIVVDINGVAQTTTTNNSGKYLFDELKPGDYVVQFVKPAEYDKFSPKNSSGSPNTDADHINNDSDTNVTTGKTTTITLEAGERDKKWDAGIYKFASLGDIVWNDLNANGIQDTGEPGIQGITVRLLDKDGNTGVIDGNGVVVGSTTTDSNGNYLFVDLEPGDYKVEFTMPNDEYKFSDATQGSDNAKDSNVTDIVGLTGTTDVVNLISGENDVKIDAGIHKASLGDFVWDDLDANGIQDDGYTGVNDVTVELYQLSDLVTPFKTTTTITNPLTGRNGFYEFTDLDSGDYRVKFIQPTGYKVSDANDGDDTKDSDGDKVTGWTETITLEKGERDLTWDYGVYLPASLGNYVWHDMNGDGIQDSGEIGINGVNVKLLKEKVEVANTVTVDDSSSNPGYYHFGDLDPGIYDVQFEMPAGYDEISLENSGGNDATDSDVNKYNLRTGQVALTSGDNNDTLDFGVYKYSQVGDTVWLDSDMNGIQDAGEEGIKFVEVNLYKKNGASWDWADKTSTDTFGNYSFERLSPGEYYVEFTVKDNHKFTMANAGDDALDSDVDTTTGKTPSFVLGSGESNLTLDAGMYQLASLGDKVWRDVDGDGLQDGSEKGISGLTVELFDSSNNLQGTQITDANGYYSFTSLEPGDYYVQFSKTAEYGVSPKGVGTNIELDSNADRSTLRSDVVTLSTGENNMSIDMGLYKLSSIGDYVWEDMNADGKQDGGEPFLSGVTVELYDSGNNLLASTTTDSSGKYIFDNLDRGDYYVKFVKGTGYKITAKGVGSDNELDSNAKSDGTTDIVNLGVEEDIVEVDAGLYRPASLGDKVWLDKDEDGTQDGDEPGVAGITVKLLDENDASVVDASGNPVVATTTDASGNYSFINLIPGEYKVVFDTSSTPHYKFTNKDAGSDDTLDSDANLITGEAPIVTLVSGENNPTIDAGLIVNTDIDIEKTVYYGHDGGSKAGGELVLGENAAPVTYVFKVTNTGEVNLKDVQINDASLAIDKSAMTLISGVEPLVPGQSLTYYYETTINGDLTNTATTTGTPTDNGGVDIPNVDKPTDSDTASVDEVVIGIDVQKSVYFGKYNAASDEYETTKGKNGEWVTYIFKVTNNSDVYMNDIQLDDAILGITKVHMTKLSGDEPLAPGQKLIYYYEDTIDGDLDNTVNVEGTPSDAAGTEYTNLRKPTDSDDAYVRALGSIGDYVWVDKNADKVQDADEVGIPGVVLELLDKDGNPILDGSSNPVTVTTDADGKYLFDRLEPGDYIVKVADTNPNLDGMTQDFELDDTLDGEVSVDLRAGDEIYTVDFGYYEVASLGDYVWLDKNEDGIQDTEESAVEGIKVKLTDKNGDDVVDVNGNPVEDTTTDVNGNYSFTNLVPGTYKVVFDISDKPHYKFTTRYSGDNLGKDSNANTTTGETSIITLFSGDNDLSIDAGVTVKTGINIEKTVYTGQDGGKQIGGEVAVAEKNMGITYVFSITNTGDTYLNNIKIIDSLLGVDKDGMVKVSGDEPLAPGSSISFYYETEAVLDVVNIAETEGTPTDKDGNVIPNVENPTDDDTAEVDVVQVGIDVEKSVYFGKYDVNSTENEETSGKNGEWVTYIFKVTNTSDTYLTNIEIKDDKLKIKKEDMTKLVGEEPLAPGKNLIYYYETEIDGDLENIVEVIGTPSDKDGNEYEGFSKPEASDDANVKALSSIGDYVWIDYDGDKVQEAGEKGIPGVELSLFDKEGNPVLDIEGNPLKTVTDENGRYIFDRLKPGSYTVVLTDTTAITDELKQNFELDDTFDGSVSLDLRPGEENDTVDFGYYTLGSIGDTVWEDADADGIQDEDEKGIKDIEVNLYYGEGELYGTTTTDEDGFYKFEKLPIGDYTVEFVVPEGYSITEGLIGEDLEKDSDAYLDGKTAVIKVNPETFNMTIDAGMYRISDIKGVVTDEETGEPIADADVVLEDEDGNVVDETKTDENGVYIFTAVLAEYYTIDIEKEGYETIEIEVDTTNVDTKVLSEIVSNPQLPKTGGKYFNYLLIGGIFMMISATFIVRENKKSKKRAKRKYRRR